jgi:hypothetical protein
VSVRVDPKTHRRWKTPSTRHAMVAFFVLAYAGVSLLLGLTRLGLTRQGDQPPPKDPLRQVAFLPTAPPAGLKHVGTSRHGGDEEDALTHQAHFARHAATRPAPTGPGQDAMTITTTAYRVGWVDPNLAGRLSGAVYESVRLKPAARPLTVRGHAGVLEVFPPGRPKGAQHDVQPVMLTWIERPGVYIQIRGIDLTERQLLKTATSLREQ